MAGRDARQQLAWKEEGLLPFEAHSRAPHQGPASMDYGRVRGSVRG